MIRLFSCSFALVARNTSGNMSIGVQLAATASPWTCKIAGLRFERLLNTIVCLADPSSVRKGGVMRYGPATQVHHVKRILAGLCDMMSPEVAIPGT